MSTLLQLLLFREGKWTYSSYDSFLRTLGADNEDHEVQDEIQIKFKIKFKMNFINHDEV